MLLGIGHFTKRLSTCQELSVRLQNSLPQRRNPKEYVSIVWRIKRDTPLRTSKVQTHAGGRQLDKFPHFLLIQFSYSCLMTRHCQLQSLGLTYFMGFHLGAGKVFVSSCLVLVSEILEGSSVPKRFDSLHDCFFDWCRRRKQRPYIRKLSQETIKWLQTTDFPSGAWSKGSTILCLLRFIVDFCTNKEQEIRGTLLHTCFLAAIEIDSFFSKIYKEGVWIPGPKAIEIAGHGFMFLKLNGRVAFEAFESGRALFPFMPNLHRLHEFFFLITDHVQKTGFCLSPLIWSNQMAENYIGKPSRVSRRVSSRLAVERTLQRSLAATHAHLREAGIIK